MNYIEYVYICMAAPLVVSLFCMKSKGRRMMVFLIAGMTMSLLSAYISTYLASVSGADLLHASLEIAPLVEEGMKLLPIVFYLLVFEPKDEGIMDCIMMTAVGFATFENVCYMTENDVTRLKNLIIRGFSTGAMHVVCGYIVAMGLLRFWRTDWLKIAGSLALLSLAISYHGIYNILVSQSGAAAVIGYLVPLVTALITLIIHRKSAVKNK